MLKEMGMDFEAMSADIDEKQIRRDDPAELVLALARAKAEALKSRISEPAILITSDQVVVWQNKVLEKPEDEKEARAFLKGYNAHPAETVTGVFVTNLRNGKAAGGVDVAEVFFKSFSEVEMDELISRGDALDYAGGFSIDGEIWSDHVERIEGARDSVLALPKELTRRLMREVGE